jgi:hypothetical protein
MAPRGSKLRVGDLLEILIGEALAYVAYIGRHVEYGDAIWVIPRTFEQRPADLADIFERTGYLTFYPAKSALSHKLVEIAGALSIKQIPEVPRHLRRAGARARTGEILAWIVEKDGVDTLRKQLSEDEKLLPIAAIWNHEFLLERIVEGWTPKMVG